MARINLLAKAFKRKTRLYDPVMPLLREEVSQADHPVSAPTPSGTMATSSLQPVPLPRRELPPASPSLSCRVSAALTPEQHRRLKARAAAEGRTMSDLIRSWVAAYVSEAPPLRRTGTE